MSRMHTTVGQLVDALKQIRFRAWEFPSDKHMQEIYEIADLTLQTVELADDRD